MQSLFHNLCKLRKVSPQYGRERLFEYCEALNWKASKVNYHGCNYQEILDRLKQYRQSKSIISGNDKKIIVFMEEASLEAESLIDTFNTIYDILAQIINLVILNDRFESSESEEEFE